MFSPESLPHELANSNYRAFRAVLPLLIIKGQVRSIRLIAKGKLSVVVGDQATFIPKKDLTGTSESHVFLVPGGFISPELVAKRKP